MNTMGETDFFSHFRDVRRRGDSEWWAKCPAHDDTDASLHFTRKDGRIVFKCFGGCTGDAVIRAVGLKWSDVPGAEQRHPRPRREAWGCTLADYARAKMFPEEMLREFCCSDRQYTSGKGNAFPSVAMEYRGEDGRTLVTRYRMSIGKGNLPRFLWEKGRTPVLYGLWRQPEEKKAIILVEGESDCHALWCGGVPAMGVPGASNYQAAWDTVLDAYKRIYIHLEKDNGGEALFNAFAGDGAGKAPSPLLGKIRFFILPQEVKDPSDLWCRTKGDRVLFALAIKEAVKHAETADRIRKRPPGGWTGKGKGVPLKREDRARPSAENGAKGGRPSADYAGLAMAYYQQCAQRDGVAVLRIWRNEWYQWDGRKYIHVADADVKAGVSSWMQKDGHAADFACQASRNAVENALLNLSVPEMCWISSRTPMHSWASTGESAAGWRAMSNCLLNLEKAAEIPSLVREGGEAPADLLEDVRKPLSPDFFSVLAMDYPYDPAAECPKFMSWLKSTQPDQEVQEAIQMMMGLLLVPDTSYNVCFMFAGEAGCGKSTFLDIIRGFIGVENTCRVPLLSFDNRFATWQLTERLVNIVGEMVTSDPQGRLRYIEGDFKDSVSGGDVHVEKKGKDPFSAPCTHAMSLPQTLCRSFSTGQRPSGTDSASSHLHSASDTPLARSETTPRLSATRNFPGYSILPWMASGSSDRDGTSRSLRRAPSPRINTGGGAISREPTLRPTTPQEIPITHSASFLPTRHSRSSCALMDSHRGPPRHSRTQCCESSRSAASLLETSIPSQLYTESDPFST